jgi:hypothetical protein
MEAVFIGLCAPSQLPVRSSKSLPTTLEGYRPIMESAVSDSREAEAA